MTGLVALCADAVSLQHPESLGLAGESLTAQEWLRVFTLAEEARAFLRADRLVDEVWVASSEDVEAINLAATLKRDRADRCVCLLAFEGTGSLWSRANAAGVDASLTRQAFVARYGQRKRMARAGASAGRDASAFDAQGREAALSSLGFEPEAAAAARPQAGAPTSATAAATLRRVPSPQAAPQEDAGRQRAAFLLPVLGGGGGVGKSTVAAVCALLAQQRGLKTLLLDFDLQFGDMPRLLGVHDAPTCDEVLANPAAAARLEPQGQLPALLAAPSRLELSETVCRQAPELLDALAGRFDVIVANTGASWADQHLVLLERCNKALFLVDQRPSSLQACQRALDLCARCGIAAGPFAFAVNRCSKRALFTSIDVSCALHVQEVFELAEGGRDVEELLGAGMPLELLDARNALCASADALLDALLPGSGQDIPRPARRTLSAGLFGRRRGRRETGGAQ